MMTKSPMAADIERAKFAIQWDDDVPTKWIDELFTLDNDPDGFTGDQKQLSQIRVAMKRYEKREANMGEDKAFYESRYRLQFL